MKKLFIESILESSILKSNTFAKKINSLECLKQRDIIEYKNLLSYMAHYEDKDFDKSIEVLVSHYIKYLDHDEVTYLSSFPCHYIQRVFELAMASFLASKFTLLIKRNEDVDLVFSHHNQKYYFECTTRSPSQMDRFYELLPNFPQYYIIAGLINEKHDELSSQGFLTNSYWYFDNTIRIIWDEMSDYQKSQIISAIEKSGIKYVNDNELLINLNNWIYYTRYACLYFKELIPNDLWLRLASINFPVNSISGEETYLETCQFAIDRIVEKIIDKLIKKYFDDGIPVILSISIATFPEIIPAAPMNIFIEHIIDNLPGKLTDAVMKHTNSRKLQVRLKNLHSILIDTCWYNWFPEIAKNRHGASFPDGVPNLYAVIYNSGCSVSINDGMNTKNIFHTLVPYEAELPLAEESANEVFQG